MPSVVSPAPTPGYAVHVQTLQVGGQDLQIRSLTDRQQYWDPLGEAEAAGISSASWPLFGMPWPSGYVLADQMLRADIEGKRVLETGCGLALASLVVQRRLGDITASDCHPLAASFLNANLQLNALPLLRYAVGNWAAHDTRLGEFDLIIGSDVLYEPAQPAMLARFIGWHAAPVADVMVVDPDRGNRNAFTRLMERQGFVHRAERILSLPGGAAYKGRVLHYRRD